jgi:hypothetical protein
MKKEKRPVLNEAGEDLGKWEQMDAPAVGGFWQSGPRNTKHVVVEVTDKEIVVTTEVLEAAAQAKAAAEAKDKLAAETAPPAPVVDKGQVTVVKGKFRVLKGYTMHDPSQKITFTDEPRAAELTSWVKVQIAAKLLERVE